MTIADDAHPRIGHAGNIAHWQRLSALGAMLSTGIATLRFTETDGKAHGYPVQASPRTLATLAPHFWLPWLTAIAAALAGLWVWTVRHHDWSSRRNHARTADCAGCCLTLRPQRASCPVLMAGFTAATMREWPWRGRALTLLWMEADQTILIVDDHVAWRDWLERRADDGQVRKTAGCWTGTRADILFSGCRP